MKHTMRLVTEGLTPAQVKELLDLLIAHVKTQGGKVTGGTIDEEDTDDEPATTDSTPATLE